MYWSPQDTRDRFDLSDLYSAQDSFAWPRVDLARPLRLVDVRPFWIISFEFVKVCWFRFSTEPGKLHWFQFYIWCYLISTILACLFTVGVRISWKKLCRKGNMEGEFEQIITKIRLSIKTTTANCRVSFIDLYLVFPTNFRIVFLFLTNTAILLERWLWYYHKAWVTTVTCVQTIVVITVKNISWNFLTGNL